MNIVLGDSTVLWSAALIIALPVLIIAAGEIQERLRQRGSALERPISTLRNYVLPLATVWILIVRVIGIDRDSFFVQVIATAAIIALTATTFQLLRYFTDRSTKRSEIPGVRQIPQLALLLPRLVVLLVVGWYLVVVVWNIDLSGLLAALGVTSLVISLALQPTLSSLASGLLLLGEKPFKPGDWIEVEEREGIVIDAGWRSTRIKDRNGDVIVLPNSTLFEANIINFSEPARLHRVVVSLQVAYHNPPTRAKDMLLAAARATEGVLEDPPPVVRITTVDDPLMGYDVQMWVDDHTITPRVKSDFGALVWYQSHRMGVPLPSPAFDLYHHDPVQEALDDTLTTEELAERIRLAPVLAGLSAEDITELAAASRQVRYRYGETIVAPKAVDRDTYVLWQGRARIVSTVDPTAYIDLGPGELFGVMAGTARAENPPAIVAEADCEVIVIDGDVAGAVASRNPGVSEEWNKIGTIRARRVMPGIGDLGSGPDSEPDAIENPDGSGAGA